MAAHATYFQRDRCFMGQSGCGNNWACGFNYADSPVQQLASSVSPLDGPPRKAIEEIMEGVRKEAEVCDTAPNFLVAHALAGGTGSGTGSRVLQELRADYRLNLITTASVVPRIEGKSLPQVGASIHQPNEAWGLGGCGVGGGGRAGKAPSRCNDFLEHGPLLLLARKVVQHRRGHS